VRSRAFRLPNEGAHSGRPITPRVEGELAVVGRARDLAAGRRVKRIDDWEQAEAASIARRESPAI